MDYEGASCKVHTSTWFDLHVSLLPGLCLSATWTMSLCYIFPTLRAAEKTRQLYFSSINASVRSGTNARLMLCLLLLVRTRRCTLFIPSGQVEQRTLKVYCNAVNVYYMNKQYYMNISIIINKKCKFRTILRLEGKVKHIECITVYYGGRYDDADAVMQGRA